MKRLVITGTGSYIPTVVRKNEDFLDQKFLDQAGRPIADRNDSIIRKFYNITGIRERRYVEEGQTTSDIAALAAGKAISDSKINPEELDVIIVAHNFGDVSGDRLQLDTVPALANRVKRRLGIRNPECIAFDILFGCPGWLQALIQVDAMFKSGQARKALVIGAEVLSRVVEYADRDSMLFSDGAGATVVEWLEGEGGLLSSAALSHSTDELDYLRMDEAYERDLPGPRFMKMNGRKVYEYALSNVPAAMKICLERSGEDIANLRKIFIHQANEKMDEAIVKAFYELYDVPAPPDIMPMCIAYLGNSSVATIPTLFDLVRNGCDPLHTLAPGDLIMFASVGAGMNINAAMYRMG